MLFKKIIVIILSIFFHQFCFAAEILDRNISLDLNGVDLKTSLYTLAKFIGINIVITSDVEGVASLHLNNASAMKAFDMLLSTHNLAKWKSGDTWFVASQAELMNRKQEEFKLQAIMNDSSPLITRVWQINYAKADDIARFIQESGSSLLSTRGHVKVDMRTNTVCIQDINDRILEMNRLIKRIDVPVKQVLIEARLANVDSDFERELGLDFNVHSPGAMPRKGKYSLAVATLADGSLLDVQLAALENEGRGELISTPKLFTANQQMASIEAGEEVPYQEVTLSGGTSIAFKKAVLSLKVTPQILPGENILLQLQINQDKPSNRLIQGVPMINTRQMSTHILVKNGQTIVLGGIYETHKENAQQSIPFLGKIPVLGILFREKSVAEHKRKLLIFVTPKIIA